MTECLCAHNNTYCYSISDSIVGVHEMHGRMHPNYCQITILLVVDLVSSPDPPVREKREGGSGV